MQDAVPTGVSASTARGTVLLVDDERDILQSYKALIEAKHPGVRVVTALTGPEALGVMRETHVDAVVSDYKMPGMDGLEFLAKVKEVLPDVPRMLFTAYADTALERRVREQDLAEEFVSKADHPRDFLSRVGSLLTRPQPALQDEPLKDRPAQDQPA